MSSFTLLVTSHNVDNGMSYHATQFAEQIVQKGHQLNGVFFYAEGVANANALVTPPANQVDVHQRWKILAQQHKIPMYSCVTAANTRGILSQQDADESDHQHHNLAEFVKSTGLGEFVSLCAQSDRVVQF